MDEHNYTGSLPTVDEAEDYAEREEILQERNTSDNRTRLTGVADLLEAWAECADILATHYADIHSRTAGQEEQERNKRDNYRALADIIRDCVSQR